MKLFLAAPASFLPSEPTALASQESAIYFFMNEVLAAPASALPSLPTAFVSQDSCANAEPTAKLAITAARNIRFIWFLPETVDSPWIGYRHLDVIKFRSPHFVRRVN